MRVYCRSVWSGLSFQFDVLGQFFYLIRKGKHVDMYVSAWHGQNLAVKVLIRSIVICYLNEGEYILFLSYVLKEGTGFEPVKSDFPNYR